MDKITTTIKREYLQEIIAGRKKVEYREFKPYWTRRLKSVQTPFFLRLINGMQANAPEVTVEIRQVIKNLQTRRYELHIRRIVAVRNWNRRRERSAV